jgi:hypothetical protein
MIGFHALISLSLRVIAVVSTSCRLVVPLLSHCIVVIVYLEVVAVNNCAHALFSHLSRNFT